MKEAGIMVKQPFSIDGRKYNARIQLIRALILMGSISKIITVRFHPAS